MTRTQIAEAKKLIGTMPREEVAERVGVSLSNLKRAFRNKRLAFHNYCTRQPGLVREVNRYYEKHGNKETAKHFGLKPKQVEHIVYRYKTHKPRQIRWNDKQIIEAARMAGLVSLKAQAKYFNRPRANEGSIKALWSKKFGFSSCSLNGMPRWCARPLVTKGARYLEPFGQSRNGKLVQFRKIILWVDMEKCLKPETPPFIRDAIGAMADFQRWLWHDENPKPLILKMIKQREIR